VFKRMRKYFKRLKLVWADGGYAGKLINFGSSPNQVGKIYMNLSNFFKCAGENF
jgi:hypothetical protein